MHAEFPTRIRLIQIYGKTIMRTHAHHILFFPIHDARILSPASSVPFDAASHCCYPTQMWWALFTFSSFAISFTPNAVLENLFGRLPLGVLLLGTHFDAPAHIYSNISGTLVCSFLSKVLQLKNTPTLTTVDDGDDNNFLVFRSLRLLLILQRNKNKTIFVCCCSVVWLFSWHAWCCRCCCCCCSYMLLLLLFLDVSHSVLFIYLFFHFSLSPPSISPLTRAYLYFSQNCSAFILFSASSGELFL